MKPVVRLVFARLNGADYHAGMSVLIDPQPLRKAIDALAGALHYWQAEPDGSGRKPHLRAGVIQSFEFSYELSVRLLRRVLMDRAAAA